MPLSICSHCIWSVSIFAPTRRSSLSFFFFFNDTATTEIYTLSLHDALPIFGTPPAIMQEVAIAVILHCIIDGGINYARSEEHTSELQSHSDLVCRLLLEKK